VCDTKNSSFLHCIEMEVPLLGNKESDDDREKEKINNKYKILDIELEMLSSLNEVGEIEENLQEIANTEESEEEVKEEIDRTVSLGENLETKVISENNIEASFTDSSNDIQIKNQSKYNAAELIGNSDYNLKNKNKVIIYHTHTCESYTSSEKYNYQMTGTYRTTDLRYSVVRARR